MHSSSSKGHGLVCCSSSVATVIVGVGQLEMVGCMARGLGMLSAVSFRLNFGVFLPVGVVAISDAPHADGAADVGVAASGHRHDT